MRITMIILILLIVVVLLNDIIPITKTWISRIHIGRYDNKDIWKNAIAEKSAKWINNTPKIKVTDNTRLVIIDKLKGNLNQVQLEESELELFLI